MRGIIVSRHVGAIEFAREFCRFANIEVVMTVDHLDTVPEVDVIVGVLPLHLAIQLLKQKTVYLVQLPNLPRELRGRELTVEEMVKYGAGVYRFGLVRKCCHGELWCGGYSIPCPLCGDMQWIELRYEKVWPR